MLVVESIQNDFATRMNKQLGGKYLHYNSYKSIDLSGANLDRL